MKMTSAVSWLGLAGVGVALGGTAVAQQSTDFDPPEVIAPSDNDGEPPQIAASGRNVFVLWHEFPDGEAQPDVFLSRSTNAGNSFSSSVNLSKTVGISSSQEDFAVVDKNIFVVWSEEDVDLATGDLLFRRSTNNGGRFDGTKKLNIANGVLHPQIVASGKEVFVAWEADGLGGNKDIFFARSDDNGRNFTPEINISNNPNISEIPQLVVSDGRVIVTWHDFSNGNLEIFYTRER